MRLKLTDKGKKAVTFLSFLLLAGVVVVAYVLLRPLLFSPPDVPQISSSNLPSTANVPVLTPSPDETPPPASPTPTPTPQPTPTPEPSETPEPTPAPTPIAVTPNPGHSSAPIPSDSPDYYQTRVNIQFTENLASTNLENLLSYLDSYLFAQVAAQDLNLEQYLLVVEGIALPSEEKTLALERAEWISGILADTYHVPLARILPVGSQASADDVPMVTIYFLPEVTSGK
jgi:hypothetical protein